LTTEEFIERAVKVHGNRYCYSKVIYKKSNERVIIICEEHDEFKQTPNGHLGGRGCVKCSTVINAEKQRKTKERFIQDAICMHGDKYDYSKVEYVNSSTNVTIICKENGHDDFEQTPNSHLSGHGCNKCAGCYKSTTDEFILKARLKHDNKYDYSKVKYVNACTVVTINCGVYGHGDFEQTPNHHLCGRGCEKCARGMTIFSTSDFREKAQFAHGDEYDYSKVIYENMSTKVLIICKEHSVFEQTPSNHITHMQGCPKCYGKYQSNTIEFIEKAQLVHGDTYNYSKVEYVTNSQECIIICKEHDKFLQTPQTHLSGGGCQLCANIERSVRQKKPLDVFIEEANIIHNNNYDYSLVDYKTARIKVIIICKIHKEFQQTPDSHLRGNGCPFCVNKTEGLLLDKIQPLYPTIITQFKQDFCKKTNKLPFDFCIPELKIIIELDGPQHFKQISNWSTPEEQFENDIFKQKCANDNGYSVIRILQEDVFNDNYDWLKELSETIEELKHGDNIANVYLCKNNKYDLFLEDK
jgi:very-short-patch-repair endonuclease